MPPRVSSSEQGFAPGDLSVRFFSWQELVAVATSTYIDPSELMMNGCIGWSPPSSNPETIVSAEPLGTMEPAGNEYATNRSLIPGEIDALYPPGALPPPPPLWTRSPKRSITYALPAPRSSSLATRNTPACG